MDKMHSDDDRGKKEIQDQCKKFDYWDMPEFQWLIALKSLFK